MEFWGLTVCCAAQVPIPGPGLMFMTAVSADRLALPEVLPVKEGLTEPGTKKNLSLFICPAVCSCFSSVYILLSPCLSSMFFCSLDFCFFLWHMFLCCCFFFSPPSPLPSVALSAVTGSCARTATKQTKALVKCDVLTWISELRYTCTPRTRNSQFFLKDVNDRLRVPTFSRWFRIDPKSRILGHARRTRAEMHVVCTEIYV